LKPIFLVATALVVVATPALAQRVAASRDTMRPVAPDSAGRGRVTKTIELHHLSNDDAVKLLTPYLFGTGGAYSTGSRMHAVTVSTTARGLADAERVLAEYDRSPVTLTLNFQLIAAADTPTRDPAVAGLDSVLRGVLKFAGYHLLSTAVANVTEGSSASQTMAGDADRDYELSYDVTSVEGTGSGATAHLTVQLSLADPDAGPRQTIFTTGVTIPIGNTVVLGSMVESTASSREALAARRGDTTRANWSARPKTAQRGLILTVRPMIDATKRRD
jgi:hypothetical protein